MELLRIVSGPVIGGLIGYFTNYIAIRMLFRPVKPVYIGRFRLPFTPGIVPRRKDELAGILGRAVVDRFFNSEDLAAVFLESGFRDGVTGAVADAVYGGGALERIKDTMPAEAAYIREALITELSFRIRDALLAADIPKLAANKGGQFIRNSLGDIAATRFLTDDMIASLAAPVGTQIERYIASEGRPIIRAMVEKELGALGARPAGALMKDLHIERGTLVAILGGVYDDFMQRHVKEVVSNVDISAQIENKVKDMSPLELEGLVLSVVKRELRGVILLGALLGFVIGIVNSFL